jgi:peptide/nickel transport system substrate-binding protein
MKPTASACLAISAAMLLLCSTGEARTRPHYGDTLRVETRASAAESDSLRSLVAESLTCLDPQGRVRPLLADRWESQNGDRRWQFFIHPRISMHDGTPLTGKLIAQVVAAKSSAPWRSVQGTETTVIFDSDVPVPNLPALLASADFAIAKPSPDGTLIGTGPFKIANVSSTGAVLDANDNYWQGRPFADRISIFEGRPIRSQWLDLSVGRTDIVEVPGETFRRAQQDHLRITESTRGELILLTISPDIADIDLRHAISASIDRSALANVVFQRQGQPAATLLPNSMTGYAVLFAQPFDLSAARAFRAKTVSVPALTISYDPFDPTLQLAAERIALNARDAGITVQAVPQNASSVSALRLSRVTLPSPDASACLDELSRDLIGQDLPPTSDLTILYRQERDLLDQARVIPLVHLPMAVATSDRIRDPRVLRDSRGLADVWIEERR